MTCRSVSEVAAELRACPRDGLTRLVESLADDSRAGVRTAIARALREAERSQAELLRQERLAATEWALVDCGLVVAGVDEVGRGALAGPVCAGACVFPRDAVVPGLTDSKLLSRRTRERLDSEIRKTATAVSVGHASSREIDALGIAGATVLAMRRALGDLPMPIGHALVDGRPVELGLPSTAIVKGDATVRAIAAAAIVAKVARDALMEELDARYPGYGLAENKGYGSAAHISAIQELGPTEVHRLTFAPCCSDRLF